MINVQISGMESQSEFVTNEVINRYYLKIYSKMESNMKINIRMFVLFIVINPAYLIYDNVLANYLAILLKTKFDNSKIVKPLINRISFYLFS